MTRLIVALPFSFAFVLALSSVALADPVALQPDVRPDPAGPTAGGSASAGNASVGPANTMTSEPARTSTSTSASPTGSGGSSTSGASASGPGTSASAPGRNSATAPGTPSADGSTPGYSTSGPATSADASRTAIGVDRSGAHARIDARAFNAIGAAVDRIASADDPTSASTCLGADAAPGTPTDVGLTSACGGGPSGVSEGYGASGADGGQTAGAPSASSCLGANASVGTDPSSGITSTCTATASRESGPTRQTSENSTGASSAQNVAGLPSTATAPAACGSLGLALMLLGGGFLTRARRAIA